ncbi:hypothetical protein EZS27_004090 [termite gut metagenome]|uniref:N-acetyltransferase domain-containing protein n=1 Tax=termite gut metagenome TaxID=433724 RepID=A0A5J4STA0_9ZZZZ
MTIETLQGTEKRMYELVAPIAMNWEIVTSQNDGAAFKTSDKHVWFVAVENDSCIGFIPAQKKANNTVFINNYYIKDGDKKVLTALLKETEKYFKKESYQSIIAVVLKRDYVVVEKLKYEIKEVFVKCTHFTKKL